MITSSAPERWQDLQAEVSRILAECGMRVEIEKIIPTVRGRVEIDVFAEEEIERRRSTILCECKHWRQPVPQGVIHGFRTVIGDIGAHKGYIISMRGFQAGAFSAAELTNVDLTTWDEFQVAFEPTWMKRFFAPHLTTRLDPLMTYTEPLSPKWFPELPQQEQAAFLALKKKYDGFGWLAMSLSSYNRILRHQPWPQLPLRDHVNLVELADAPVQILEARGYRELLESAVTYGEKAIGEFRAIRDRNGKTGGE
jgi:restriction system protein